MKRGLVTISFCLILLFSLSCAPPSIYIPRLAPLGPSEAKWIKKTMAKMTREEKVGQMIGCRYNAP
ncbi:MAG: hypothetical protein AB1715_10225, partial [Acidobacteriota bacterium]